MSTPQERARAALQAGVHMKKSDVDAIRDQVVSDVVNKRRGMSLESAMKSSKSLGMNPLALYTATQAGAISAKKQAGELSPGGVLRACAPVVDQLAKADLDVSDLDSDQDLAEAIKELHNLLNQASAESGNGSNGGDSGGKATKSTGDDDRQPARRDAFGKPVNDKATGVRRGPSGEPLGREDASEKSVEQLLSEDRSDQEDADDGGDWLARQVRRGHGGIGSQNF